MSLKSKFAKSSGWMLLGTGSDYLVQFVIFAVLARVLPVKDLGIVAFAIVFVEIGRMLVSSGFGEAVVQRKDWDPHVASVCYTFSMVLALICALTMALGGGFVLERYYEPGSGLPTAALSTIFLLEASRSVHSAKLRREFKYRSLAARASLSSLIAGAGAVYLALTGWGIWALVVQRLAYQIAMNVFTWRAAGWTPSMEFDRNVLRELAPFTVRVVVSRAIEVLNSRVPDVLVGILLGPVAVAIYRVGARGLDAVSKLGIQPFQDASFAAFSRVGESDAVGRAYLRVTRAAALVTFPVHLGMTTIASELVVLVFGPKYVESGPVLMALAFGGVPSTLLYFTLAAYLAAGRPKAMLHANSAALVTNIVLVGALTPSLGILGAAIGMTATQLVLAALNLYLLQRYLQLSSGSVVKAILPPLAAAAGMAAILWAVKFTTLGELSPILRVTVLIICGGLAYPLLLLIGGRKYLRELLQDVAPILPKSIGTLLLRI